MTITEIGILITICILVISVFIYFFTKKTPEEYGEYAAYIKCACCKSVIPQPYMKCPHCGKQQGLRKIIFPIGFVMLFIVCYITFINYKPHYEQSQTVRGISIGMTSEYVRQYFGNPKHVNRTIVAGIVTEQWIMYDNPNTVYVYFTNGKVTAITE